MVSYLSHQLRRRCSVDGQVLEVCHDAGPGLSQRDTLDDDLRQFGELRSRFPTIISKKEVLWNCKESCVQQSPKE